MLDLKRINHVGIRVFDLNRSRAFYEQLGFRFVVGPVGPEPVAVMDHTSGITLNLILNAAGETSENPLMDVPEKLAGYTHMALEVPDLEAAAAELERLGIPLSGGPVTVPDGASFIFVRDPDRNVIEFHQPAPT